MNTPHSIILDPYGRTIDMLFGEREKQRLESLGRVLWFDGERAPDEHIERHLPDAVAIIGRTPMPKERLDRAPNLRAILDVSGGFHPLINYEECHRRHIHVLSCAAAFAPAVAEMGLGLAITAARNLVCGDTNIRQGVERYSVSSNEGCFLLTGKTFGVIGCGNVGRALINLLGVFGGRTLVHDPWLHPRILTDLGTEPVSLDALFGQSRVVFIVSAPSPDNASAIGARHFALMEPGSVVVLIGRAAVVDFDALLDAADAGHIRAAIDVYPEEPVPGDHRVRTTANTILSSHRAGGLPESYRAIGRMVVDDLELILKGQRPQRMESASVEILKQRGIAR